MPPREGLAHNRCTVNGGRQPQPNPPGRTGGRACLTGPTRPHVEAATSSHSDLPLMCLFLPTGPSRVSLGLRTLGRLR